MDKGVQQPPSPAQGVIKSENPDRLERVRSMHIALIDINHNTLGWLQYANNPDVMSMFNLDE